MGIPLGWSAVASSDHLKFSPGGPQRIAKQVALSQQIVALGNQRIRRGNVPRASPANEGTRCIFAEAVRAFHQNVQGETFKTKLVLAGRPSMSLISTRTICSPGGSSVSGI